MVAQMVARQYDYWRTVHRRTWRGSVFSAFLTPVLYIVAMGLVLGRFIDAASPDLGAAPSYLHFVAPGLVAGHAMLMAMGEVLWPVMGMLKWNKTYHAMIATPLSVPDILVAHLAFILVRVGLAGAVFLAVLAALGVVSSFAGAVLAWAAQLLIGLAFAAPFYAVGASARTDSTFSLVYRVVFMPLYLFSGAFFPIGNLAPALQVAAMATPLWHGVELTRMATLGVVDWPAALVHVAYLTALSAVGMLVASRVLTRRLVR